MILIYDLVLFITFIDNPNTVQSKLLPWNKLMVAAFDGSKMQANVIVCTKFTGTHPVTRTGLI
jgi:hypothetical protein